MTSPLREMTAAARRMAGGDYGQRVTATSSDEVGDLARAFNAMAADLASADTAAPPARRHRVARAAHPADRAARPAREPRRRRGAARRRRPARRLHQSERLSALVADLLDLSRIDAGVAPAGRHRGAGRRPARAARWPRPRSTAGPCGCGTRRTRPTSPCTPTRRASPSSSRNLVDNAVRHSPPGRRGARHRPRRRRRRPGGSRCATRAPASRPTGSSASSTGSARGTTPAAAPASAWPSRSWVCELHGGRITALPTTPDGTSGARPAGRAAAARPRPTDPTHLTEERTMAPPRPPAIPPRHPAAPPRHPPPTPSSAGSRRRRPAAPRPRPTRRRRWPARRRLAGAQRARPAASRARRARHRRVGRPHLARAQRRPRGRLTMLATGLLMWWVARYRRHPWTVAVRRARRRCSRRSTMLRDAGGVVALAVLVGVVVAAAGTTLARTLLAVPLSVAGVAAVRPARAAAARSHDHGDEPGLRRSGRCCARSGSPSSRSPCSAACSPPATRCSARGPRRSCPTSAGTPSSRAPSCSSSWPGSRSPAPTSPSTRRAVARRRPSRAAVAPPTPGSGRCPSGSSSRCSPSSSSRRPRRCGAATSTSSRRPA